MNKFLLFVLVNVFAFTAIAQNTYTFDKNHARLSFSVIHFGISSTKPIEFDVTFNGKDQNPFTKKYSYGFTISGKLNRSDFGIGGEPLATGVGKEIELKSNVEFGIN